MTDPIKHVVVLMMENRSFDHMLGGLDGEIAGLDGIAAAKTFFTNPAHQNLDPANKSAVEVTDKAVSSLGEDVLGIDFDPHHEFPNVCTQLGQDFTRLNGFVADADAAYGQDQNYGSLSPSQRKNLLSQVMAYHAPNPKGPVSALHDLARSYLVCDRWFSSVPGPTWPNRFFALAGTARGHLKMPDGIEDIGLLFRHYDMPTIFNRIHEKGLKSRIYYHDVSLTLLLSQTHAIDDLRRDIDDLQADVDAYEEDTFPAFTFIEPRYFWDHFGKHPNDQHPPHDVGNGDALIAQVYNTLRSEEELWQNTLFVVLYDEHGGFADHVVPPTQGVVAPDGYVGAQDDCGFNYQRLGLRVPAILASPWLPQGICHETFDHTSLLKYLSDKWSLGDLGERTAQAASFAHLVQDTARPTLGTVRKASSRSSISRGLRKNPPLVNANQRALAHLVDFLGEHLMVGNASAGLRDLDQQGSPNVEKVTRKVSEIESRLRQNLRAAQVATPVGRPGQPMRVLMVHGIGQKEGVDHAAWQEEWRAALTASASQAGYVNAAGIECEFAQFDDIFDAYPLSPLHITKGLALLAEDMFGPTPGFGQRGLSLGLAPVLRWTAGMILQWIENAELRARLAERLQSCLSQQPYDLICAHSLGGMICYDSFRRHIAKNKSGADFTGKCLLTFGSQIAHPAVQSVIGGRIEPLVGKDGQGFNHWVHLYNTHDHVFTRPLPGGDERTHSITVSFDIPGDLLNHRGDHYLKDPLTASAALPLLLGLGSPLAGMPDLIPVAAQTRSKRRALLVGINEYPKEDMRLNGCINDVFLMSALLQEAGFDAADIRVLTDERATREALLERLTWLSDGVEEGDERVFFYSGHGAQMDIYGPSGEPVRKDETLVPVDFDWSPAHAFTDKEFHRFYSHFPHGANFIAILDCCHAGGMTRGGHRVRGINPPDDARHRELRWDAPRQMWVPRDFVEKAARAGRAFRDLGTEPKPTASEALRWHGLGEAKQLWNKDNAAYEAAKADFDTKGPYVPLLLFAAAQSELASEYDHGATAYGAFSFVLAKTLREKIAHGQAPTFATLVADVSAELKSLGYAQSPQIYGPTDKRNGIVPIGRWKK